MVKENCYYNENIYNEISIVTKNENGNYIVVSYDKELVDIKSIDNNFDSEDGNEKKNESFVPTIKIVRDGFYDIKKIIISVPDTEIKHQIPDVRLLINDFIDYKIQCGYSVFMDGEKLDLDTFRIQTVWLIRYSVSENKELKEVYIRKNPTAN